MMSKAERCKFLPDQFIHTQKCTHCCLLAVIWEPSFWTEHMSINCLEILHFPECLHMQLLFISLIDHSTCMQNCNQDHRRCHTESCTDIFIRRVLHSKNLAQWARTRLSLRLTSMKAFFSLFLTHSTVIRYKLSDHYKSQHQKRSLKKKENKILPII